MGKLTL